MLQRPVRERVGDALLAGVGNPEVVLDHERLAELSGEVLADSLELPHLVGHELVSEACGDFRAPVDRERNKFAT